MLIWVPKVSDAQLLEATTKACRKQTRQEAYEGTPVVAHQLEGLAAEFEAIVKPLEDGRKLRIGVDSQPNHESGVVVYLAGAVVFAFNASTLVLPLALRRAQHPEALEAAV